MSRQYFSSLALAASLAAAVLAQGAADVYCGSFTPLKFRVASAGKQPQARADQAMEVINKYLGGKAPVVKPKAEGRNIKLLVQRDVLAVVTPEDARAEKAKSVKVLAETWTQRLNKALKETCAVR